VTWKDKDKTATTGNSTRITNSLGKTN